MTQSFSTKKEPSKNEGFVIIIIAVAVCLMIILGSFMLSAVLTGQFQGVNGKSGDESSLIDGEMMDCSGAINVPSKFMQYIQAAAAKWLKGDQSVLIALISTESYPKWDPKSKSTTTSATGLGQFVDGTARGMQEFVGGDDKNGKIWPNPPGQTKSNVFGDPDSRLDPERSIYAIAHSLHTLSGRADLNGKSWPDIYQIGYHTGNDAAAIKARKSFEKNLAVAEKGCTDMASNTTNPSGKACGVSKIDLSNVILNISKTEAVMMPTAANDFNQMANDWKRATGTKLAIMSMFRSREKQIDMYRRDNRGIVARPGGSMHEAGLAIDVGFSQRFPHHPQGMNPQEYETFKQIAKKYNFTAERSSNGNYNAKEAWHFNYRGTPYYYGSSLKQGIEKANSTDCTS